MIPIPKISLRTAAEVAIGALLVIALFLQTVRIEGFQVWPIHIHGLKEQLAGSQKLAADTQASFDRTVAGYRAAAEQARQADAANLARAKADQAQINERTSDEYEARIADARARSQRLQQQAGTAAADSGSRGAAAVPRVPASPGGAPQAAGEGGLPGPDALTATEQAIQLDELIKWVRSQAAVDVNGKHQN